MVCGALPFDHDHLATLFERIKEGRFFLPNYVSRDLRDLINRMLQPNPIKRIKLKEIQQHRWFVENLPAYLKELSNVSFKRENAVDVEIVHQLYKVRASTQP
jgi:carbon catabolite-derepressing protein kinase